MQAHQSERIRAIILRRVKLKEQDLIVNVLTAEGEQLSCIARGARKPTSKLAACVDLCCEVDMLLKQGKGSLPYIREAELVHSYADIRYDIDKVSSASCVMEVASKTSYDGMKDAYHFAITSKVLQNISSAKSQAELDMLVASYTFKLLAHFGWKPVLNHCVACGESSVYTFSALQGGVLCSSCANTEEDEPIDTRLIHWIDYLLKTPFDSIVESEYNAETATWLMALAHQWGNVHLDCRLKSFEFLCGM